MNPSNNPLVSVIIPAYNAEEFIVKTLQSVVNQTYQNLEIIVIDDGSQDGTKTQVDLFIKKDERIKYLYQINAGVAAARNLGIETATGEFIAPIDADDIWYPQNIEKQVKAMISGGNQVGLVYSWSVDIDENDRLTGAFRATEIEGSVYPTLVSHNFLGNASCSMIRRSIVQSLGGYNRSLKQQNAQGCEDWDFYLKIAESYQIKVVKEFLVGYRKLPESMSRNYETMARSHALIMEKVQVHHREIPGFFYRLSKSNLYMYFAHQSSFVKDYSSTLYWLKEAIKAEPFTPFIRPGLYLLLMSSFFNQRYADSDQSDKLQQQQQTFTAKTPEQQKLKLQLMLGVENIFHSLVMFYARANK
ncbi:glycosyltransferase family 2 protein [Crocosphaera sp. UHCC 0190]|uniref:glycosyltransferase family 2 protein n=1 Tax=Crocosphaera sp. UHCC 0190 TaxID=3110246 RepID=UPI002B215E8E|nr:glycosyltransferase family 2 protein [Crocosphaera sp. UHCC 0190]MEA5511022.1 glycosyltransferase family 2 protein [Crocosphaera sp. UHCC 0190]